jgi:TIR domain
VNAIFVSYAHADLSFVRELRSGLVKSGHEVWLDVDEIAPSDDWLASIERALENAEALVFVVSRESLRSESCMHELRLAAAHGKRIIALIRSCVEDKPMPDELAGSESIKAPCRNNLAVVLQHLDRTL